MPLARQESVQEKPKQQLQKPPNLAEIAAIGNKTQKGCEPKIRSPFFLLPLSTVESGKITCQKTLHLFTSSNTISLKPYLVIPPNKPEHFTRVLKG